MLRVCQSKEDAEDALGGAILVALKSASQLRDDAAFQAWLRTIGTRVCSRLRKNSSVETAFQEAEERGLIDTTLPEMEMQVMKGCVLSAYEKLAPIYRDIYFKCELQEKTVPEAAEELGISLAAAKSRLLRAKAIMRESLDNSICA